MYQRFVLIPILACYACGTPDPQEPHADERYQEERQPPLRSSATTIGEIGAALGIRPDYVMLANVVCANRMRNCDEPHVFAASSTDCSIWIAEEWCRDNDCQIPFLGEELGTDPCHRDAADARCDDMARAVDCPALREAGINLPLNAWPKTPRPSLFP